MLGEDERITREIIKSLEKGEIDQIDADELLIAFGTRQQVYPPRRRGGRRARERIQQGMARARVAGKRIGRPPKI